MNDQKCLLKCVVVVGIVFKGYKLSSNLTEEQCAEMKAHMAMVNSVLANAEV